MTTPILTVPHMKAILDVSPRATEYDARIGALILATTRIFETACRRGFARSVVTERRDARTNTTPRMAIYGDSGLGSYGSTYSSLEPTRIILQCDPVDPDSPVEVRYDQSMRFGDDTIVPADGYSVDYEKGTMHILHPTRASRGSLKLTYTAGYPVDPTTKALAADTCPAELALACELHVTRLFRQGRTDTEGTEAAVKAAAPSALDPDVKQYLVRFRRILLGSN